MKQNDLRTNSGAGDQKSGAARLIASLDRVRAARGAGGPPALDLKPGNAFEIAIAEQIKAMRQDLDRLEARLWWLFALILGAAAANVIIGLFS